MFSKNTPMSTAAEKVAAHLAKVLQPARKAKAIRDPATQLLASMSSQSSLPKTPSPTTGVFAALKPTTKNRNNANLKGKK